MSVFGGRECADAFHLISVLSFYVCYLGEGNAQMHSVDLCLWFGGSECADAFRLISVVSFYVCCLGKRMRIRIPFDFCSVYLCLLFGGRECADAFRLISVVSFYV